MATVGIDCSSLLADSQPKLVGLVWRLAVFGAMCIHCICMNWLNSRNGQAMLTTL